MLQLVPALGHRRLKRAPTSGYVVPTRWHRKITLSFFFLHFVYPFPSFFSFQPFLFLFLSSFHVHIFPVVLLSRQGSISTRVKDVTRGRNFHLLFASLSSKNSVSFSLLPVSASPKYRLARAM